MMELRGLTKRFGETTAVDDLTCTFLPGLVTGFLGPNGAGKTTTMMMALGLQRPTSGTATIMGRRYIDLPAPMSKVGVLLDARALHPRRTARDHLLALAVSNGLPRRRVDEVLEQVGLSSVARKPGGTFSLGMSQRLGIAGALLGDPAVLLLDEPVNGLDPGGIAWARNLMRTLAAEGRTVVVSSHLMSEMELTADHLVVIGRGKLIADTSLQAFIASAVPSEMVVRAEDPAFGTVLGAEGATVREQADGSLLVSGLDAQGIARLAMARQVLLTELTPLRSSLEEVFMSMTEQSVQYEGGVR